MKKRLLLIAGFLAPVCLSAQVTLTSSTATPLSQLILGHSYMQTKIPVTMPNVNAATNATWDMSVLQDSFIFNVQHAAAANPSFPNAQFTVDKFYPFGAGLTYEMNTMEAITATGHVSFGEQIARQALPLGAMTGDNNDSIVFLKQDVVFTNSSKVHMKYPATFKSAWSSVAKYNTNFELTITAYGLNQTPGQRRTAYTIQDTVIGWGKMRVKNKSGQPSGYVDVLQVNEMQIAADSFFLGGGPAPAPLLTAFGLTQGQQSIRYFRYFYRTGETMPLAEILYTDATYTQVSRIRIHRDALPPTGIANTVAANDITIYPNPVTNRRFTISAPPHNGQLSYTIANVMGQQVAEGVLPADGKVILPSSVPAGMYTLLLQQQGSVLCAKRLMVSE